MMNFLEALTIIGSQYGDIQKAEKLVLNQLMDDYQNNKFDQINAARNMFKPSYRDCLDECFLKLLETPVFIKEKNHFRSVVAIPLSFKTQHCTQYEIMDNNFEFPDLKTDQFEIKWHQQIVSLATLKATTVQQWSEWEINHSLVNLKDEHLQRVNVRSLFIVGILTSKKALNVNKVGYSSFENQKNYFETLTKCFLPLHGMDNEIQISLTPFMNLNSALFQGRGELIVHERFNSLSELCDRVLIDTSNVFIYITPHYQMSKPNLFTHTLTTVTDHQGKFLGALANRITSTYDMQNSIQFIEFLYESLESFGFTKGPLAPPIKKLKPLTINRNPPDEEPYYELNIYQPAHKILVESNSKHLH